MAEKKVVSASEAVETPVTATPAPVIPEEDYALNRDLYVKLGIPVVDGNIVITTRGRYLVNPGVIIVVTTAVMGSDGKAVSATSTTQYIPEANISHRMNGKKKVYFLSGGM